MITQISSKDPNIYQKEQIKRKFGMFIHFGINTFLDKEWSDGSADPKIYHPSMVDTDQWVKTAFEAGMNYCILTTKHHDGFCMWNTATTTYGINNSSNNCDVVKKLSKSCRKYNVKLGLYYSLWDRNCKFYQDDEKYIAYMLSQLTELFDGEYGEICELWLDGGWDKSTKRWGLDRIYDLTKRLQPACQIGVNHTIGNHELKGGMAEEKYFPQNYSEYDPIAMYPSDFRLLDPLMPKEQDPKLYTYNGKVYYMPFEGTIALRKDHWFYNEKDYKDADFYNIEYVADLYRKLISADNLLVINLPPNRNGVLTNIDLKYLYKISEKLEIKRQFKDKDNLVAE